MTLSKQTYSLFVSAACTHTNLHSRVHKSHQKLTREDSLACQEADVRFQSAQGHPEVGRDSHLHFNRLLE